MLRLCKSYLARLTLLIFSLIVVTTPTSTLYAQTVEREINDRTQGVTFYDVNPQDDLCFGGGSSLNLFGSDLYFLGDTIGIGLEDTGDLRDHLPQTWVINSNSFSGRRLSGGDNDAQSALDNLLDTDESAPGAATDARIIVLQLGTFDAQEGTSASEFQSQVESTIRRIREVNAQATIIWIDSPATFDTSAVSNINSGIYNAAENLGFEVFSLFDFAYPNGINGSATSIDETSSNGIAAPDSTLLTNAGYVQAAQALGQFITLNYGDAGTSGVVGGNITWPSDIDPEWVRIWTSVGAEFGVDPKILAAIFTSEHNGQFYPTSGDGGPAEFGGWAQPATSTAVGPFQILNGTWDDMRRHNPSLPARTNGGTSDPRNDPWEASRGAAVYLDFMGAPEGLPSGSWDQEWVWVDGYGPHADYDPRVAEEPWTVASLAGRYNQGPYWRGPGNVIGVNNPEAYVNTAIETYIALGGQDTTAGISACNGGSQTSGVVIDGYAFPIAGTQAQVQSGYTWPCPGICHHDGSPAFDLSHDRDDTSTGVPVFAVTAGRIENFRTSYRSEEGCNSYQLIGQDGWHYWYGHTQSSSGIGSGVNVRAGQQVAVIGERRCTGNGSYPHLHIDRGFPQGRNGGSDCCRDQEFVPLINQLYENLP